MLTLVNKQGGGKLDISCIFVIEYPINNSIIMHHQLIINMIINIIVFLFLACPAFAILSNKKRGVGYYILVFFFPLIGLIVACCLKNLDVQKQKQKQEVLPPSLDITEIE